ncbi:MAG: TraR/DksA family transcriptional regulator [Paracoccaceae bacterium]
MDPIAIRKQQLQSRLAELRGRLKGIESSLEAQAPRDDEDRASEREEDEVLESLGNTGLQEIQMIEAALGRIEDESYGYCARCGEQIPDQRLDVLPYTPVCRKCAR